MVLLLVVMLLLDFLGCSVVVAGGDVVGSIIRFDGFILLLFLMLMTLL